MQTESRRSGSSFAGLTGRNFATACNMLSRVTVAGLAGDAAVRKRQAGVMVPRAGVLHLSAAHVAAKAACATGRLNGISLS